MSIAATEIRTGIESLDEMGMIVEGTRMIEAEEVMKMIGDMSMNRTGGHPDHHPEITNRIIQGVRGVTLIAMFLTADDDVVLETVKI